MTNGWGVLDPVLEQREGVSGKTGEMWGKLWTELTDISVG